MESPRPAAARANTFEGRPSGAPVMMHARAGGQALGGRLWTLLGAHSSRLDAGTRELAPDEAPGLNCAWDADILPTLAGH